VSDLRPVWINEHHYTWRSDNKFPAQEGLFHCWAGTSEIAYALIELKGGVIRRFEIDKFVFIDNPWGINKYKQAFDGLEAWFKQSGGVDDKPERKE
jgi:hypothetical protein